MAFYADFEWSEVGQRILARRSALQKTQQQVARQAGLTQNAIYRLEAGTTNPQLGTLKAVAKALGTSARELVCGITDADPKLGNRLAVVRRILESGDDAAIRAMDYGLENAQTLLDRTSGVWDKDPPLIRLGGRTYNRSVPEVSVPLKAADGQGSSNSRATSVSVTPSSSRKFLGISQNEIEEMTGYRLDDAPHLPVGNAKKIALPNSNRQKEQYATTNRSAASARPASSRR